MIFLIFYQTVFLSSTNKTSCLHNTQNTGYYEGFKLTTGMNKIMHTASKVNEMSCLYLDMMQTPNSLSSHKLYIVILMSSYMSLFSNNVFVGRKIWTGSYHQIVIKLH